MPNSSNQPPDDSTQRQKHWLRRVRLWEKKRGSRSTGSTRWGGAGEALFYAAIFLFGVLALSELIVLRIEWNVESFLTSNLGLGLCIPMLLSLIVAGAAGALRTVIFAGTSAERRAAMTKVATNSDLLSDVQSSSKELPAVPKDTNWKNSPGVRLAYRLPIASSPAWRLVVFSSFCLVWNGAVAVLAVIALQGDADADGSVDTRSLLGRILSLDWWTVFRLMVVFYAIVGAIALNRFFKSLLIATAIGPCSVEVSAQPFRPGRQYKVFLSQSGHLKIKSIELRLVCDEEVSFSDGTNTRAESKRIFDQIVFRKEKFDILPGEPFQHECPLDVPSDGMHSFMSAHNAVVWKLVVQAETKKWSKFERVFPLVVYPAVPEPVSS